MDFSNRHPQQQNQTAVTNTQPVSGLNNKANSSKNNSGEKTFKILTAVLTGFVLILLVALVISISFVSNQKESKLVAHNRLQAVFLNTGQVYFGNITTLNNTYYMLTNIFYLQTTTPNGSAATAANARVSLVKLGCELHAPYDQMMINSKEVTFWENLKPTGQVAKAVSAYEKSHPNGQQCTSQSNSAPSNATSGIQGSPTNSATTPTTTLPSTRTAPAITSRP